VRKVLAPVVCLLSVYLFADFRAQPSGHAPADSRALPGYLDVLYAADGDLNYAYGPKGAALGRLTALDTEATAVFSVAYDVNFDANPGAKAAFQAAVNIWARTIASPVPIRVRANFVPLGTNVLGSAGPTRVCSSSGGMANTWYAAALADKLKGTGFCAEAIGYEIEANFSSSFTNWDFGTLGTGEDDKYNFMTVAMHELGHGLGFFGSARASSEAGVADSSGNPCSDSNPAGTFIGCYWLTPHIYDRFIVTGTGMRLLNFTNPSQALAQDLVGNNMFFDGGNARAANAGQNPKIETHNFQTSYLLASDNGWRQGSSFSHVDDVLYTGTPNGLMTFALNTDEVYTDPGPIVRGMLKDQGWTITGPPPPPCSYVITPTALTASLDGRDATVAVTAAAGCGWTATSHAAWVMITGAAAGSGNGMVTLRVAASTVGAPRTGTLTIAGQTVTVTQAGVPSVGDFDGDGAADLMLFRPDNGDWMMRLSSSGFTMGPDLRFGLPTDKPVPGDYDGDGRLDMAVYRPSNGIWYVIYAATGVMVQLQWGIDTDIPMPADYTGDGRTDLCVWRPATGVWFIFDLSKGTYSSRQWGVSTDIPLTGDYDGDGLADVAAFRPANGYWYVFFSSTQTYGVYQWGVSTDIPLPADYTGDGRTDIAVYRPANGYWFVYDSTIGNYATYQWGVPTDIPTPKDYDGDGRTDLAIWRPASATWFVYFLGTNTYQSVSHGAEGDVPIK
jgi:hypothetical protein